MNSAFASIIRMREIQDLLPLIPVGVRVLEIGAGAGWQALELSKRGILVEAVDLDNGVYADMQVFPVRIYNGKQLPFPDSYFDVIYSSNVLEHILAVEEFQVEISRVLKPSGIAIHGFPTSSWRIWTMAAHYPHIAKRILTRLIRWRAKKILLPEQAIPLVVANSPRRLRHALYAPRHGEFGNALSEVYYFSRRRWVGLFLRAGWSLHETAGNKLFYTGYSLLGGCIPLRARAWMSVLFGSSTRLYILKKSSSNLFP